MSILSRVVLTAVLMVVPCSSFAQKAENKRPSGTPKSSAVQQPSKQKILQRQYGSWTYRCLRSKNASKKQSCEISQSVMIEQNGKRIEILNLAISRARDKAGKVDWALVALTPLDVHLPSDFGLMMGKQKPLQTRYRNCNHLGCWIIIPASKSVIKGLKKSSEGAGIFRLLNGKIVRVVFSLKGFAKAFTALSSGEQLKAESSVKGSRRGKGGASQ
jgi:invasion protein IalB